MAKHDVSITLPERWLGKADAEFKIYQDGKLLGQLTQFGRPSGMVLYRSGDDPVQYDAEIVRTMLAGGRRSASSTFQ